MDDYEYLADRCITPNVLQESIRVEAVVGKICDAFAMIPAGLLWQYQKTGQAWPERICNYYQSSPRPIDLLGERSSLNRYRVIEG